MPRFKAGDIVSFKYSGPYSHDPSPMVLILNPSWGGFVHAINLNYLTTQQTIHLLCLAYPDKAEDLTFSYPAVKDFLKTYGEVPNIHEHQKFYYNYVQEPATRLMVYRKYRASRMNGINFKTVETLNKFTLQGRQERERVEQGEVDKLAKEKEEQERQEQEEIDKRAQEELEAQEAEKEKIEESKRINRKKKTSSKTKRPKRKKKKI
jgi:hypothetical protein